MTCSENVTLVRGSVAVPYGDVEALGGPRLKPQVRIYRLTILGQNHPIADHIPGALPNAADSARDANGGWNSAKPLQLNVPVRIAVGRKLITPTDIIFTSHA